MYVVQEIYYITTGSYKHRKECYLVSQIQSGHSPIRKVLTREQLGQFHNEVKGNLMTLPPLKVQPTQFKEYEKQIKY